MHIIVLAVVQGVTEFLPVSSSGHLILVPMVTGWPDQGLLIDVAVHIGTLGAVMVYLWRDMAAMAVGGVRLATGRLEGGGRLLLYLAAGTRPGALAGLLLKDLVGSNLRSAMVIGWATLGFGVVLYAADRWAVTVRRLEHMRIGGAVLIGLAQVLALIPGTSRSGVTITAARVLGYQRRDAARFSMLLSIPTILAAGTLLTLDLVEARTAVRAEAAIVAGFAFAAALIAIAVMMKWLEKASFTPFVVYRLILGALILAWAYGAAG